MQKLVIICSSCARRGLRRDGHLDEVVRVTSLLLSHFQYEPAHLSDHHSKFKLRAEDSASLIIGCTNELEAVLDR